MLFMVWEVVKRMLFSELYSVYYNTVADILKEAVKHPLCDKEINCIVEEKAFVESVLTIPSALKDERWQLLLPNGTSPLNRAPTMPLTTLQKRWINAISKDPRMRLFTDEPLYFDDVEPLFLPEDICIFDKYADGDDYEDANYIQNFRLILDAIKNKYPLKFEVENRKGNPTSKVILPEYLEYSQKDDKFRLIGAGFHFGGTINLGRVISCVPFQDAYKVTPGKRNPSRSRSVVMELVDHRNALERVLLHFAHFEKQAEKLDEKHYRITVYYDKEDETEVVIRVLSFGPMIKVTAPAHFIELIKKRLIEQKSCGH